MHPLRRMPSKMQTRRIEIESVKIQQQIDNPDAAKLQAGSSGKCVDQNPKKAAERQGDMPSGCANRTV